MIFACVGWRSSVRLFFDYCCLHTAVGQSVAGSDNSHRPSGSDTKSCTKFVKCQPMSPHKVNATKINISESNMGKLKKSCRASNE